jgi:PEP-CTERM motif
MCRFAMAGLTALALISFSNMVASAGSVHLGFSKAEVQAARVRLYEHEMHLRAENPAAFDRKHPVLGSVLASEQGYNEFFKEHTFSKLLCVHTPFLWRVVAGDILYHKIHPFVSPQFIPDNLTALQPGGPPWDGGSHDQGPATGDPGGLIHSTAAVPEPSSWVLMAAGLVFALLATARRWIYRLAKASPQARTLI